MAHKYLYSDSGIHTIPIPVDSWDCRVGFRDKNMESLLQMIEMEYSQVINH